LDPWKKFVMRFPDAAAIGDASFQQKPARHQVKRFVAAVMNECVDKLSDVKWISVRNFL
jgi:hypothetical protein